MMKLKTGTEIYQSFKSSSRFLLSSPTDLRLPRPLITSQFAKRLSVLALSLFASLSPLSRWAHTSRPLTMFLLADSLPLRPLRHRTCTHMHSMQGRPLHLAWGSSAAEMPSTHVMGALFYVRDPTASTVIYQDHGIFAPSISRISSPVRVGVMKEETPSPNPVNYRSDNFFQALRGS
jgi:hypothetical protein